MKKREPEVLLCLAACDGGCLAGVHGEDRPGEDPVPQGGASHGEAKGQRKHLRARPKQDSLTNQ